MRENILGFFLCMIMVIVSSEGRGEEKTKTKTPPLGVNVTWFNTWNETQPLANVALTGRGHPKVIPLDSLNQPKGDFDLLIYEGGNPGGDGTGAGRGAGGAQVGLHHGRFSGKADLSAGSGVIDNVVYDAATNTTTFTYTTSVPEVSVISFKNTRRDPSDQSATGVQNLSIMRPGHKKGDLLNTAFVQAMEPFSAFRVGPNWGEWTYQTDAPVWKNRAKPGGMFTTTDGVRGGGAPWETLAAMANKMQVDLWICLPPNADDEYLTKIFQIFLFGSDGVNPYTSPQTKPVWAPLDKQRKLYFEIGNEIWNWAKPYRSITQQVLDKGVAEHAAGDPYHYGYAGTANKDRILPRRLAWMTARISRICRKVVGDKNMMTRFRPILCSQSARPYVGGLSISYLKCVMGGHDWHKKWQGKTFPGEFIPGKLKTPEDGISKNEFGNVAHPLNYWIYGYAVAPYLNGGSVNELLAHFNDKIKQNISDNIDLARRAGVEILAYEGGIEAYHSYKEDGLDRVIKEMLKHWYDSGGGLFMYYSLAGNTGSGLIPDMTRQDPAKWPKMRAMHELVGLKADHKVR